MALWNQLSRLARQAAARLNVVHRCAHDNVYHACIQKSGSQWIKQLLRDPVVVRYSGLTVHDPGRNFIKPGDYPELKRPFPTRRIISPLYITADAFAAMPRPQAYKLFWVMRDPRDVVCSKYFSARYSHPLRNDGMARVRDKLGGLDKGDGLMHFIDAMARDNSPQVLCMQSWIRCDDPRVMICRYEDLVGADQEPTFRRVFDHLDIPISDAGLRDLLKRYSFEALSGRRRGEEDEKSHYRKGVEGDWRNHFTAEHRHAFKQATGTLLVELGYEPAMDW